MAVDARILEIIIRAKDMDVSKTFDKISGDAAKAGAAIMAVGLGGALALNKATNTAVEYGSQVVTIQRLTGLAAKESSEWTAILSRYGVEGKQVGLVVKSLSNAIVGQSAELRTAGIATKDAEGRNRSSMAVLGDLAEYYSKATDKTQAVAVAAKTLGKGYMTLLPILANGRKGIEELTKAAAENGLVLTQDSLEAVKAYNKALKDNTEAAKGLEVQTGMLLLPYKTEFEQAIGKGIKSLNMLSPAAKKAAVGLTAVASGGAMATGGALVLVANLPKLAAGLAMVKTAAMGTGLVQLATNFGVATTAAGGFGSAMASVIAMNPAAWFVALGAASAAMSFGIMKGSAALTQWGAKQLGFEDGLHRMHAAQIRAIPVLGVLADVQYGAGYSAKVLAEHQQKVIGTTTQANGTIERLTAASGRYTSKVKDGAEATKDYAWALRDEAAARLRVSDSLSGIQSLEKQALEKKLALKDAQKKYNDLVKDGKKNTDEGALALLELRDAEGQYAAATDLFVDETARRAYAMRNLGDKSAAAALALQRAAKAFKGVPTKAGAAPTPMAWGGKVTSPLLAMIAEEGDTEYVVNPSKPNAMSLVTQILRDIGRGPTRTPLTTYAGAPTAHAAASGASGVSSVIPVEVPVYLDGRQIARGMGSVSLQTSRSGAR